jgi:hypothetical protein
VTGDVSLRAAHLFDNEDIDQLAYQKAPLPIIWGISTSGDLLGMTYLPEEQIGAWHHHTTDGTFESCAVVAEGAEDHLYVVVNRTGGRYIERMDAHDIDQLDDAFFVDSGVTYDGTATVTINDLDHLEGKTVKILADGAVFAPQTVTSGQVILPGGVPKSKVQLGLGYTTELETLPMAMQLEAFGRGRMKNVNQVDIRVFESGAFSTGPTAASLAPSTKTTSGALYTGPDEVVVPPRWQDDGILFVRQTDPLPLTIVELAIEVAIGG